jgi:hypothetical protein
MAILDFTQNRGVKMTFSGVIVGTIVRVGLCFVPQVPSSVADNIFWGIIGMFGGNVVSQRVADGISKGKTATITPESALAQIRLEEACDK